VPPPRVHAPEQTLLAQMRCAATAAGAVPCRRCRRAAARARARKSMARETSRVGAVTRARDDRHRVAVAVARAAARRATAAE